MTTNDTSNNKPNAAEEAAATQAANDRFSRAIQARNAAKRNAEQRGGAERTRDANLGGPRLKMDVIGRIPGFHLYWENDQDAAIEQLLYEGFDFVEAHEVRMQSHIVSDADIGNRVSKYVGRQADGSPLRAYLLKCPDEVWAEREANRHAQADAWDDAIRRRNVVPDEGRYTPKGMEGQVDTKYRKEY